MAKLKKLLEKRETLLVLLIVVLSIFFGIMNPVFFRPGTIVDIFRKNYVLFLIGIAEMIVILCGGIDVSVGQGLNAICLLGGHFMVLFCDNFVVGLIVFLVLGVLLGTINGFFITKVKIHPWVQTIAMMNILQGTILYFQGGRHIDFVAETFREYNKNPLFEVIDGRATIGITGQVLFVIAGVLITWFVLERTKIGRSLFAVGGNPEAAAKCGINVDRVRWLSYIFCGLLLGLCGFVATSMANSVTPFNYTGFELDAISITVLGGTALIGGRGSVVGTVLAVLVLSIVKTGIVLIGVPSAYDQVIVGAVLMIAAGVDAIKQIRHDRQLKKVDVE